MKKNNFWWFLLVLVLALIAHMVGAIYDNHRFAVTCLASKMRTAKNVTISGLSWVDDTACLERLRRLDPDCVVVSWNKFCSEKPDQ